jgi:hypothetical protein
MIAALIAKIKGKLRRNSRKKRHRRRTAFLVLTLNDLRTERIRFRDVVNDCGKLKYSCVDQIHDKLRKWKKDRYMIFESDCKLAAYEELDHITIRGKHLMSTRSLTFPLELSEHGSTLITSSRPMEPMTV